MKHYTIDGRGSSNSLRMVACRDKHTDRATFSMTEAQIIAELETEGFGLFSARSTYCWTLVYWATTDTKDQTLKNG